MTSGIGEGEGAVRAEMSEVLEGLNDLLQLDHDSVGAYEIAREFLKDQEYIDRIEAFQKDHERHIRDLNDLILKLGGTPANEPHVTAPLKEGIQRISAAGGDRALLTAWRANELQSTTLYDRYAQKARFWPPEAKLLVDRNALDEERHYRWGAEVLGKRDPGEIRLAGRLRERSSSLPPGQGGEAGTPLRERAAERLAEVAGRLAHYGEQEEADGLRAHAGRGAREAARGLEATARVLRESGAIDPRAMLEREIRGNPVRSLVATFAIGFVIGRVLRP